MEIPHFKAMETTGLNATPECTMNLEILSTEKWEGDFPGGS